MLSPLLASFAKACGSPPSLSLTVSGGEESGRRALTLEQPFALLGQAEAADLRLQADGVSRRHAYLQMIDGRPFVVDLHSRTGTRWAGAARPAGWLDRPFVFEVGPYAIRLDASALPPQDEESFNPLEAGSHDPRQAVSVVFEVGKRSGKPVYWGMNRRLALIGNWSGCKIRLHGKRVSRCHACLLCTPRGLWVVDLLSRDGLFVNGQKVRLAPIAEGDKLQVGEFLLVPHFGGAFWTDFGSAPRREEPADVPSPGQALTVPPLGPAGMVRVPSGLPTVLGGGLPPTPTGAEAPFATVLGPLVEQFSKMQQQMFDQFHHTVMGLFQMFGSLYKDQFELIRDELTRVQELTRELQELQTELSKTQAAAARSPGGPQLAEGSELSPLPESGQAEERSPAEELAEDEALADSPTGAAAGEQLGPSRRGPSPAPPRPDIHAWLCKRMAEIQAERQGRWQKILNFLTGQKSS